MTADDNNKVYNIALVGSGGVGTIASLVLSKSGRANVTAVLRSKYTYVSENGWDIESKDHGSLTGWKPYRVVPNVSDAAPTDKPYDYVVVSTKQLPEAYCVAELIAPLVTPSHTTVLLIQNGIGIEDPCLKAFPNNAIMTAVSMLGSKAVSPNIIQHVGSERIVLGPHFHDRFSREEQIEKARVFAELYEAGGCKSAVVELDMPKARWQKLLWNGTFNTLCALMGCDVGELQSSGGRETMLVPMMYELLAIAKGADGVEFENGDGLVKTLAYGLPDDCPYRPSMLVDADHGRPMEIETILGEAVRKAKRAGVEAPKCESTYNLLKVLQWKNAQKALGFNGSVGGQPDGTHLFEKKEKKNTDGGFIMSAGMEELTKAQKEETAEEA